MMLGVFAARSPAKSLSGSKELAVRRGGGQVGGAHHWCIRRAAAASAAPMAARSAAILDHDLLSQALLNGL
jgi:hypothetical protein